MEKEWIITKLKCKTNDGGLTNVVQRIKWRYKFTETVNGKVYETELYGSLDLPEPDPNSFTLFNDLTKQQVEEWIILNMGDGYIQYLEQQLQSNLNELIYPTIVLLDPPF